MRRISLSCRLLLVFCSSAAFQVAFSETEVVSNMHLIDGERPDFMELTVADVSVPALYRIDRSGRDYGAVLLLHDENGAIDSQGPVSALRKLLPEHGWSVMTVALSHQAEPVSQESVAATVAENTAGEENTPVETAEQDIDQSTESEPVQLPVSDIQRIQAAVMHLQADNPQQLVMAGVGAGALEAIKSMASLPMPAAGLILIQTPALDALGQNVLNNLRVPVLDITAGRARDNLQKAAQMRAAMMARNQHAGYSQRQVAGAGGQFSSQHEPVAKLIRNWLYQRFIAPERKP